MAGAPVDEIIATLLTFGMSMPTAGRSDQFGKPNIASQPKAVGLPAALKVSSWPGAGAGVIGIDAMLQTNNLQP
jgi:hypothetical protein